MFKKYKKRILLAIASLILGGLFVACGPATYGVAQSVPPPAREFKLELMDTVGLVEVYEIRSSRGIICIMVVRPDMVELAC